MEAAARTNSAAARSDGVMFQSVGVVTPLPVAIDALRPLSMRHLMRFQVVVVLEADPPMKAGPKWHIPKPNGHSSHSRL